MLFRSIAVLTKVTLPALSAVARGKLICSLIAQAFSPIQKAYQALTNITATATNVKNSLKNLSSSISNQITGIVNGAISSITGQVKALANIPQSILNSFNAAKDELSKQSKNIKSIITGEIDCITNSLSENNKVSSIDASIRKEADKQVSNLTNNELKVLSENSFIKNEFITNLTNDIIEKTSPGIAAILSSGPTQQTQAILKLENLT